MIHRHKYLLYAFKVHILQNFKNVQTIFQLEIHLSFSIEILIEGSQQIFTSIKKKWFTGKSPYYYSHEIF